MGAQTRSGPPADPGALARARDGKEWTRLPAAGRVDADGQPAVAPEWPAEVEPPTMDEVALWRRLWRLPQALMWEADHCFDIVALYVRCYIKAMDPSAPANAVTQAKQISELLLLTVPAMLSARCVVVGSAEDKALVAAMGRHPASRTRQSSARDRMHVVPDVSETDEDIEAADTVEDIDPESESDEGDDAPPF